MHCLDTEGQLANVPAMTVEVRSSTWRCLLGWCPPLEKKTSFLVDFWLLWPLLGSGGVWKWSWAMGLLPVLIWAQTEPYGPISDQFSYFVGQKISDLQKSKLFLKCKSHHLAILINIWHVWEDRSRKVNNDEPDLRFFHGNFWPVISHAVRKPCFSAWIPRGQISGSP